MSSSVMRFGILYFTTISYLYCLGALDSLYPIHRKNNNNSGITIKRAGKIYQGKLVEIIGGKIIIDGKLIDD